MNKQKNADEYWMGLALAEAMKGRGHTSPNPAVGAVLVRNGRLLAKGYHHRAGQPHAEVEVLRQVKNAKGATLYVTLEPCCHTGKRTPPCTGAILQAGIREVVVGCRDPNPQVSGRGLALLKKSRVKIRSGVMEKECREINSFYNFWIKAKRPYVVLKSASSLDGKVALDNGASKWITGRKARAAVHLLRGMVDAIMVGVGTVIADDPQLTMRLKGVARQPIRVVIDPRLQTNPKARMLRRPMPSPVWIFTSAKNRSTKKAAALLGVGAQLDFLPATAKGELSLPDILRRLGEKNITSLMVEGGSGVWTRFLKEKLFQEWWMFIAPKLLGAESRSIVNPLHLKKVPTKGLARVEEIELLGDDLFLRLMPA